MRVVAYYSNHKYVQGLNLSIIKKNDTYNNVRTRYTVIRDFPKDLRVWTLLYVFKIRKVGVIRPLR